MERITHERMMQYHGEIFKGYYTIHTRAAHIYTDVQMNLTGIPYTGDQEWDEHAAKSFTTASMTIAEIAELHESGLKFYFKYPESTVKIYDHIKAYTTAAVRMMEQNYLTENRIRRNESYSQFIDDLNILVNLANHLRSAISYIKSDEESKLLKDKGIMQSNGMLSRIKWQRVEDENPDIQNDHLPDRLNLVDTMSPRLQGKGTVGQSRPWLKMRDRVNSILSERDEEDGWR